MKALIEALAWHQQGHPCMALPGPQLLNLAGAGGRSKGALQPRRFVFQTLDFDFSQVLPSSIPKRNEVIADIFPFKAPARELFRLERFPGSLTQLQHVLPNSPLS